jgi:hypothetical protein
MIQALYRIRLQPYSTSPTISKDNKQYNMNKHKYFGVMIIALFSFFISQAQHTVRLGVNYTVGIPAGGLRDLAKDVSPRGFDASLMVAINPQLELGLQGGFQDFYQRNPRAVFHESGSDLSAVVTNSIQVRPILAKGLYHFGSSGMIQPYAALGVGGNLISYTKYYGAFTEDKTSFGFAAQPELGLQIPIGAAKRTRFNLSAAYNYMPFEYNDADGLHHAAIKAGLSFPLQ